MRLRERVAIVTGAGRGIGRAIAVRFAREGARLVGVDRDADGLATTAALVGDAGGEMVEKTLDLTGSRAPSLVVNAALERFGGLDILVNNAGVASVGWIESVTDQEYDRVMSVNVESMFRLVREAAPHLKESRFGRVINLASVEGVRGSGLLPAYCMSKHAVVGLTRSVAIELGREGVTANCLCPGPIDTAMLAPLVATPELRDKVVKKVPLRRLGTPDDVAGCALFLASDDGAYVNGHTLVVDGGMTVDA